jgi:hypothetical protein
VCNAAMGKQSKRNARGAERSQQKALQKPSQEVSTFVGEGLLTEANQVKSDARLQLGNLDMVLGTLNGPLLSVVENPFRCAQNWHKSLPKRVLTISEPS